MARFVLPWSSALKKLREQKSPAFRFSLRIMNPRLPKKVATLRTQKTPLRYTGSKFSLLDDPMILRGCWIPASCCLPRTYAPARGMAAGKLSSEYEGRINWGQADQLTNFIPFHIWFSYLCHSTMLNFKKLMVTVAIFLDNKLIAFGFNWIIMNGNRFWQKILGNHHFQPIPLKKQHFFFPRTPGHFCN